MEMYDNNPPYVKTFIFIPNTNNTFSFEIHFFHGSFLSFCMSWVPFEYSEMDPFKAYWQISETILLENSSNRQL